MKKTIGKLQTVLLFILLYVVGLIGIVYILHISGKYPSGDDTMYHIYRAEFLIENFKVKNFFPLYNEYMYNGVQLFRYFAPASAYCIAIFQMLGQVIFPAETYIGYEIYTGFLYFVGACGFLWAGIRRERSVLGGFLGCIWFLVPNALFNYFVFGNMAMGFCLAFTPYLYSAVFEWIDTQNVKMIKWIVISTALIILGHLGFGGMVALALLLYLVLFKVVNFGREKFFIVTIVCMILTGALVIGIWVLPGAVGGMVSAGNTGLSDVYFQNFFTTVNPFARLETAGRTQYFGLAALLFSLFAILFCHRKEKTYFIVAVLIAMGSSLFAYPMIASLPGGRFLWMLRFLTLAVCLVYFGFLYWKTLRPWIAVVVCVLLVLDIIPSVPLIYRGRGTETPEETLNEFAEAAMLDEAKEITKQRIAVLDGATLAATAPYYLATGEKRVKQTYGAGFEAAYTRINITMLNEAMDQGEYLYLFDNCLALGNDTVLLRISCLKNKEYDVDSVIAAANEVGYSLKDQRDGFLLFSYDTPYEDFGVKSKFEMFGIGSSIGYTTLYYPNMLWGDSYYVDDYTFEDLSRYHTVLLDHFFYHDKDAAENLVKQLADSGVRVVISSDGIPTNEKMQTQEFMGAEAMSITFENGYPLLYVDENVYDMDLFATLYKHWKTTFVNGLDDTWGYFMDDGLELPFLGTVYNENVVVVGLNLFFHYTSTQDLVAKDMVEYAMDEKTHVMPKRELVPLDVNYGINEITIDSPEDDVNTTIACQDNFKIMEDKDYDTENHLLRVNKGVTKVSIQYPYKGVGVLLSIFGFFMWALLYIILRKRYENTNG